MIKGKLALNPTIIDVMDSTISFLFNRRKVVLLFQALAWIRMNLQQCRQQNVSICIIYS